MIGLVSALFVFPVCAESPAFMREAPEVAPLAASAVPTRHRFKLENELSVVFIPDNRPLVTARLVFRGAARLVGRGGAGTADAFASLLTAGTPTRSAREIAEDADAFGGTLAGEADDDDVFLSGFALAEKAEDLFAALDACAFDAQFPAAEVRLRRENMIAELGLKRGQADYLAETAFNRMIFGPHPYGSAATEDTIAKIDRPRLRALHARASVPSNMILYIVGDIERERLDALLKRTLGARTGRGALTVPPYPQLAYDGSGAGRVTLLDRPGSAQASLRVGHHAPREIHADYPALTVANMALGGSFAARLTADLREKRGYTYGIYSRLQSWRSAGAFQIKAELRGAVAKKSIALVRKHIRKLRRRGISAQELRQAKNLLVAGFVREFETQAGVLQSVSDADLAGLPEDYLDRFVERIQAVTREEARSAARAHLHPDAAVVVVGDATTLEKGLKRLTKQPLIRVDENGVPF